MYDDAIDAYEKSLKAKDANAEAHYNLGLLYENVRSDKPLASKHYKRYLELDPKGKDAAEVSSWIERLK
jgi:tetratricopeptide (TPR) repeat protein